MCLLTPKQYVVLLLVGAGPRERIAQRESTLDTEEDGRRVAVLLPGQRVRAVAHRGHRRGQVTVAHRHSEAAGDRDEKTRERAENSVDILFI